MFSLFPVLTLVAAVTAAPPEPFLFNNTLLLKGHPLVAKLHHHKHDLGGVKLRFAHLVPKLSHAADVKAFASKDYKPLTKKTHFFLDLADDEVFLELLAFSDCKTWHGTLLTFKKGGAVVHRTVAWVSGLFTAFLKPDVDALVAFLYGKLTKAHFDALVKAGLPAHPVTTALVKLLQ